MTQTLCLHISMATPLLMSGDRVTHSGELIRDVVTSATLPLGAFEDDSVCVSLHVYSVYVCVRIIRHSRTPLCFGSSFMSHILTFNRSCLIRKLWCGRGEQISATLLGTQRKVKWDWLVQIISEQRSPKGSSISSTEMLTSKTRKQMRQMKAKTHKRKKF